MRTHYLASRPSNVKSVFDDFFNFGNMHMDESFSPKSNIRESADQWNIDMMVPGMPKDAFKIEVVDNRLVVKAEVETSEEDAKYRYREFNVRSFERSFNLPKGMVNEDEISAKYVDGILQVVVPKREEVRDRGPRTIEIQ